MTLTDLIAKAQTLEAQRIALDAQIEAARVKAGAIEAIKAQMTAAGVTIDDLGYGSIKPAARDKPYHAKSNGTNGKRIEPKFRGPTGETWTGRGLRPRWLKAALAGGATLEQFKIAA